MNSDDARQRFESFKLGGSPPGGAQLNGIEPAVHHTHTRSHSRNNSISSSSLGSGLSGFSFSSSSTSLKSSMTNNDATPHSNAQAQNKRPNSHHRRRSSVSTRRESAELMGVSIPDLPQSSSDDNVNFGDKDSIRRRALWALEGKGEVAFSKVELPQLDDVIKPVENNSDFASKPSFPPGSSGTFSSGLSSMSKRDSFRLMGSSAAIDQLHTLVEEEEEEEEECAVHKHVATASLPTPDSSANIEEPQFDEPLLVTTMATPPVSIPRRRPANLNLRPLSLTPDALISGSGGLPTPATTPSPKTGLRSLSLSIDLTDRSSVRTPSPINHRPNLRLNLAGSSDVTRPQRRSSISYKPFHQPYSSFGAGLPTPEMTPTTSERPLSSMSSDGEFSPTRPLSTSEQHFLFKSHNALLARITDLERALTTQSRMSRGHYRPMSTSSEASSAASSEPNDEMLQLIRDLKAERDELKRDADGWRTRIAGLDKQVSIYSKRVDTERAQAWTAQSNVALLKAEKVALEKTVAEKTAAAAEAADHCDALMRRCEALDAQVADLQVQLQTARKTEEECALLRAALEGERKQKEELERALDGAGMMATPTATTFKGAFAMRGSISESCGMDVVLEEDDDDYVSDEEANGLDGYEDGDEGDMSFCDEASIDSDEFPRGVSATSSVEALSTAFTNNKAHSSDQSAELSTTWTFPRGAPAKVARQPMEEVDRFFGCLGEPDHSRTMNFGAEDEKNAFTRGFGAVAEADDDFPPFFIPADVGFAAEESPKPLQAVAEEAEQEEEQDAVQSKQPPPAHSPEEYEDNVEEVDGGIRFTFSPPPPALGETGRFAFEPLEHDDDDSSFTFPQSRSPEVLYESPAAPVATSPKTPSRLPSPSSIPRFMSTPPRPSTARGPAVVATNTFVTPPTRRGGATPSFIPQPSPAKPRTAPSLLPQPSRRVFVNDKSLDDGYSTAATIPERSHIVSTPDVITASPDISASFSFQSISSFMPSRWGFGSLSQASPTLSKQTSTFYPPKEKKFVNKEKQLQRLRTRLQAEGVRRHDLDLGKTSVDKVCL